MLTIELLKVAAVLADTTRLVLRDQVFTFEVLYYPPLHKPWVVVSVAEPNRSPCSDLGMSMFLSKHPDLELEQC